MRVNHVGVRVSDLDASQRFYTALGFTEKMTMDVPDDPSARLLMVDTPAGLTASYLTAGSFILELIAFDHHAAGANERGMTDAGLTHISLGVDDLAAAKQAVVDNGGTVVEDSDVGVAVMVRDPDGQLLELLLSDYRPVTPD